MRKHFFCALISSPEHNFSLRKFLYSRRLRRDFEIPTNTVSFTMAFMGTQHNKPPQDTMDTLSCAQSTIPRIRTVPFTLVELCSRVRLMRSFASHSKNRVSTSTTILSATIRLTLALRLSTFVMSTVQEGIGAPSSVSLQTMDTNFDASALHALHDAHASASSTGV